MRLKKWENPNVTSLNLELTKSCTYDSPHYWHCKKCGPIISPGQNFTCQNCGQQLIDVGCGPHPS